MFRSATFKLTLYYLLIIAVISVSFSVILYQVTARDLASGFSQQSQRISDNFPVFTDSPYLRYNEELEASRQHLVARLILCNLLVLAIAGFASYALARQTLRPIQAAHERQQRFTADVSHELRTPLTALKMESEVALLDPTLPKSQLRATLASNVEEAEKLTLLISNLLRLSQLDYTARRVDYTTLNINEPLLSAIEDLQSIARQRNITINKDLGMPIAVFGDEALLRQLFKILVENAIKYSPNNSTIAVTTTVQQANVCICISDQGIGIARSELDQVFERFYRADSARTSGNSSGFGIGLSIAKLIADGHNASISLTSKVGSGTAARFTMAVADQSKA